MVSQGSRATDPQQDKIRDRNQNGKGNVILVTFNTKKPYRFPHTAMTLSFIEQVAVRPSASECQH